jgi:hypothetical protein
MDKIKGLGDLVAIFTKYTGIKWIVKKLYGNDCGCDERQEKLNKIYPINKPQSSFNKVKEPHPTPPKSYEK